MVTRFDGVAEHLTPFSRWFLQPMRGRTAFFLPRRGCLATRPPGCASSSITAPRLRGTGRGLMTAGRRDGTSELVIRAILKDEFSAAAQKIIQS